MSLLAEPPPLLSVSAPSPRRPPSTRHTLASGLALGSFRSLSPITSPPTSPKPARLPSPEHPVWKAFPPAPEDDDDHDILSGSPIQCRPSHRIHSVSVGGDVSVKRANSDPRRRSLPYPSPSPSPSNSSSPRPLHTDPETISRPALFHLQADDDSDDDDDDEDDYVDARSDEAANGARSGDDPLPKKRKVNSNASRYYALLELLQTEAHYLLDLRILVNIYLEQLPTLQQSPPKLSPSVSSHFLPRVAGPSAPSSPFKQAETSPDVRAAHKRHNSASSATTGKEKTAKTPPASLLSPSELEAVRRNGKQLLAFHGAFLDRLRSVVSDPRFRIALDEVPDGDWDWDAVPPWQDDWEAVLNSTIVDVMTLFTTQASLFSVYEPFCAGQPEANDVVARVARKNKDAWESYERRCSELVGLARGRRRRTTSLNKVAARQSTAPSSFRTSIDAPPVRRHSFGASLLQTASSESPEDEGEEDSSEQDKDMNRATRLKLVDYLVKPMQRVTRYPLLLGGLLVHPPIAPSAVTRTPRTPPTATLIDFTGPDVVVTSARLAMDHVASQIDAAASEHAAFIQSARIAARLAPAPHVKLASFVSGLGLCQLAGALDVVHHRALRDLGAGSVRAKYLAGFLYCGGYLVLAKVQSGRRYEPRHWFDFSNFEIDGADEGGLLPWSIRLYSNTAEFELACSCAAEKRVWLHALREAVVPPPIWLPGEEPSSVGRDFIPSVPSVLSISPPVPPTPGVAVPTLPPIPPISPVADLSDPLSCATTSPSEATRVPLPHPLSASSVAASSTPPVSASSHARPKRGNSTPQLTRTPMPPSRRSSTASVKAFFSAAPESAVMISRATALARAEVDDALRDVLSTTCADARARAGASGLFEGPSFSTVGRGEAGVGMAGAIGVAARNRLRKRESVLVRRSVISEVGAPLTPVENVPPRQKAVSAPVRPPPVTIAKRRGKEKHKRASLSVITDIHTTGQEEVVLTLDGENVPDTQSSTSHSNSHAHSIPPVPPLPPLPPVPPPKIPPALPPKPSKAERPKSDVTSSSHPPLSPTSVTACCDSPQTRPPASTLTPGTARPMLLSPGSPVAATQSAADLLAPASAEAAHISVYRSHSMVDNVRGFFTPSPGVSSVPPGPPTRSASVAVRKRLEVPENTYGHPGTNLRRRVTDSLRFRSRSGAKTDRVDAMGWLEPPLPHISSREPSNSSSSSGSGSATYKTSRGVLRALLSPFSKSSSAPS